LRALVVLRGRARVRRLPGLAKTRALADFTKIDWTGVYLEMARKARAIAGGTTDPQLQEIWSSIATSWELISQFKAEACFCGEPSVGAQTYEDGSKAYYCGDHLANAIANSIRMHSRTKAPE
jgi:hypothetical protein